MKLYGYFRSSAAYRVRIALNLKSLSYEQVSVLLAKGAQYQPEFGALSPQQLVPVLYNDDGERLLQSLAIIEYLDQIYPQPRLLPEEPLQRHRVQSLALSIACEIHPLNNVRVLNYLTRELKVSEQQKQAWYAHWVKTGFDALESRLAREAATGRYCHGDRVGFADIALVPQVANANRFKVDMSAYPTIRRINDACLELDAFRRAMPDNQPDAE